MLLYDEGRRSRFPGGFIEPAFVWLRRLVEITFRFVRGKFAGRTGDCARLRHSGQLALFLDFELRGADLRAAVLAGFFRSPLRDTLFFRASIRSMTSAEAGRSSSVVVTSLRPLAFSSTSCLSAAA